MKLTFKDWFYFVFIGGVCVPAFILFMIHGPNPRFETIPMSQIDTVIE